MSKSRLGWRSQSQRYFPVIYAFPFIFSALRFDLLAKVAEPLRWIVLIYGLALFFDRRLVRSYRKLNLATTADLYLIAMFLLFFGSAMWSIDVSLTVQRSFSMLLLLGVIFLTIWRYVDTYSEFWFFEKLLQLIALLLFLSIVLSPVIPESFVYGRLQGLFRNPNSIGVLSALIVPLSFVHWYSYRGKVRAAISFICLLSLFMAGTRSATASALIAIILILVVQYRRWSLSTIFAFVFCVFAAIVFTQSTYFGDRILRLGNLESAGTRVYIWELAKEYIANKPLFGHGFGVEEIIHDYYGVSLFSLKLRGYGAMSSYYGLAVQVGWLFTIASFVWLWLLAFRCLFSGTRNIATTGFGSVVLSGLIVGISEPVIFSAGNVFSFIFWLCVMLGYRRLRYEHHGVKLTKYGSIFDRSRKIVR